MMSLNHKFSTPLQSREGLERRPSQQHGQSDSHLAMPRSLDRRASYASTFSEISDIAYMSNDHRGGILARTMSNASNASVYSIAGPLTLRQKLHNLYYQNYGALLVLASQIFGTGMNVTARLLEQPGSHGAPMHPFQILFVRQSLTALMCTAYALWTKSIPHFPLGPPDKKVRLLLVSRGVLGFFSVFGMYFSLLYLPLSEATVLTFLAPILTCYIATYLLPGERFTRQQQIAGLVSFIGVIFIARPVSLFSSAPSASVPTVVDGDIAPLNTTVVSNPSSSHNPIQPTNSQHLWAIAIAMLGVFGATGAMLSIRAIGTRAHAFISVNYFSVWSVIVSVIALIALPDVSFRLPGSIIEWALLLNLGICGFILQALLTMGLSYGGPANASDVRPRSHANKLADQDIELQPNSSPPSPTITPAGAPSSSRTHHSSKPTPKPSGNRATSMVYCQMLYALAADKLIFGTVLGIWSWIGSGLILAGAIWVATAQDGSVTKSPDGAGNAAVEDRGLSGAAPTSMLNGSSSVAIRRDVDGVDQREQVGLLSDAHDGDGEGRDDNENTNDEGFASGSHLSERSVAV